MMVFSGLRVAALFLCVGAGRAADFVSVQIIDRHDAGSAYTYVVPGYSSTNSGANVACAGNSAAVNCSGSGSSTTTIMPGLIGSYRVAGATLSLRLADGRVAVVNCSSKLNWNDYSKIGQQYRSCRIPLFSQVQAQFDGNKAKLRWVTSVNGKKFDSETYRILGILDAPPAP